jgi:hypothetical protein
MHLAVINTITGMAVDIDEREKPVLGNNRGGLVRAGYQADCAY